MVSLEEKKREFQNYRAALGIIYPACKYLNNKKTCKFPSQISSTYNYLYDYVVKYWEKCAEIELGEIFCATFCVTKRKISLF